MMFDPICPAQEVAVPTEEECVESCAREDIVWAPIGDDEDACTPTFVPYVDCLTTLSCDEVQRHFILRNMAPDEERSSCGGLLRAQLNCQTAHY